MNRDSVTKIQPRDVVTGDRIQKQDGTFFTVKKIEQMGRNLWMFHGDKESAGVRGRHDVYIATRIPQGPVKRYRY